MTKSCSGKFHYCLFLIIISLSFTNAHSQGSLDTAHWRFSNPKQFGFTVIDLDFFDNNKAIAVGNDGGIAYTSTGGTKWTYGPFTFINPSGLRVKPQFLDVHYVTANVAYAVGLQGCMAKTSDAGQTWNFITTPLYARGRNINTVWFINKDTGYIGGQHNTPDSLPKIYFTRNGGASWDSLNAPTGGKTAVGYINNPNLAPLIWDIDAKDKEIYRIEFANDSVGYISGGGTGLFPIHPAVNTTTCVANGTTTSTSAQNASLLWKFTKGVLTDYSLSKERLGYTGINSTPLLCSSRFGNITPQSQVYRAFNIISDSMVVLMSFNNNIVVRVRTGKNDSTLNINVPGVYEKGKYEVLNFPFPPNSGASIPATQVLLASNPYWIRRAANGKLYASANFGNLWTSADTGRTWKQERSLPPNQNFSAFATWALDITPSGRFVSMGLNGVIADSIPGGTWNSSYVTIPASAAHTDMEFADCNNGIATGGASISVTTDGGKTWIDRARPDFVNLNISINGFAYPFVNKAYFATSSGVLYRSADQGATLDPIYADQTLQFNDLSTVGTDSIWMTAYNGAAPTASRTTSIIRSFNNGVSFQTVGGFPVGSTAPNPSKIAFTSKNIGYVAGTRNAVYKTTDGGTTWTSINPFPSLNEGPTGFTSAFVAYTEIQALDDNTVFLIGNMFTNVGVKRVYKTINGGATWTDITSNLSTLLPVGNLIGIAMHDANSGYVTAGSTLFYTTDGGANWSMDIAPVNSLFETLAFAPRKVPAAISMTNRKLFVTGVGAGTQAAIMEYGKLTDVNINTAETIVNASCTNPSGGSITVNGSGGLSPYTYSINGGAFQSSNVFAGLNQGVKTIIVKDAFCGTVTKTVNVGFTDNLVLTTNNDTTVCAGAPVPMLASTNGTGTTYVWTPSTGLSAANIANPVATINAASAYTVNASLNGCVRNKTINIGIRPNPVVNAGPDKTILIGEAVVLNGSASGSTQSVLWSPAASLTGANTLTPTARPQVTTTYTLTVKDANSCTSIDSSLVTVIPYCVKPMEAFSPNGDGTNDRWLVTSGSCTDKVHASVFNRYGNVVYKQDNYKNDWDGTYNGKPVADGTYYYVITFYLINGKQVQLSGNVTILR